MLSLHMIIKIVIFHFQVDFIVLLFEKKKRHLRIPSTYPSDVDSILHHFYSARIYQNDSNDIYNVTKDFSSK